MIELLPHPYAQIFPLRGGDSLVELSDSMAAHGQLEDIVLFQGKILDGRRRYAAAIRAGLKPRTRKFGSRPSDGNDPLEFAYATNYHRRDDMTEAEKVLAAVAYANFKRGDNQHTKAGASKSSDATKVGTSQKKTQKEASEKFGVNPKQMERAKAVTEKGVPELIEAMHAGTVTVTAAAGIVNEPPKVQRQAVAAVVSGEAKTLAAAVAGTKPAPAEDAGRIARDLDKILDRLGRVVTDQKEASELALAGLRNVVALIRRL